MAQRGWLSIAMAWALVGCDDVQPEPDLDVELRSEHGQACGLVQPIDPPAGPPTFDCTERQDVGYDAGVAFDITVVTVDDDPVEKQTANAFWVMREAAAADGVDIHINSGFRTMEEQEYFYMCGPDGCCCCNSCNLAAAPGYSNHQSGHALDLSTSNAGVYSWLAANGADYGWANTVPSEDWHWEWWGGGPGGGICDITAPPAGSVDAAGCETISGWAQDPDAPTEAIEVQVVFDGALGDPGAVALSVVADDPRDDLCETLGSCDHGFEVEFPLGLRDGANHSVRVYAMDQEGEMDAELPVSPPQLACAPPPIPEGVRRLVPDPEAFASWGFSPLHHVAHVDDAAIAELEEGLVLGDAPFVVTTDGSQELWLVEHGWRRPISDTTIADAWGFSLAEATVLEVDALELIAIGPPVRDRPFVVTGSGPDMYLVDDPLEDPRESDSGNDGDGGSDAGESDGMSGGDGGSDDEGGLSGGSDRESDDGCACSSSARTPAAAGLVLFALGLVRRRRVTGRA